MEKSEPHKSPWAAGERLEKERDMNAQIEGFNRMLRPTAELSYTFQIDPIKGTVLPFDLTIQAVAILTVARAVRTQEGVMTLGNYDITPDHIRMGALKVREKYPDIHFEFSEDRTRHVFGYRAFVTPSPPEKSPWKQK